MQFRKILASALLLLAIGGQSWAQPWPAKQPIRVVLPFSPGSSLDTLGRPVFDYVSKQIGQAFVFEHRPGAGGTIGMAQAVKAEPDGYTLLLNSSVHMITPSTYTLAFDVRAISPASAHSASSPTQWSFHYQGSTPFPSWSAPARQNQAR